MSAWQRVKCFFGAHEYYAIGRCGIASLHVGCRFCPREWGMNDDARAMLPWRTVSEFHRVRGYCPPNPEEPHNPALRTRAASEQQV